MFKYLSLLLLSSFFYCVNLNAADSHGSDWWNKAYPSTFDENTLKPQAFIKVKGNQFVDDKGKPFIFRGVNIADPDKLAQQSQWQKSLFSELANNWGVNTIRLPVHPVAWQQRGKEEYLALIDDAVKWANSLGIYLIVDWHSIGYLPTEQYQHPMYDTTIKETRDFWRTIAFRYQDVPTIAVYELFNEPTTQNNTLGQRNWSEWKALNESLIDMIYARDKNVIPLVAGFNWAFSLADVKDQPIEREGIAYAAHPYPQKAGGGDHKSKTQNFAIWDEHWGFAADRYPIIATEIGWVQPDGFGAHQPVKNDGSYGPQIIEYIESKNVSYTVWCFDPEWSPTMIADWKFTPTEQGAFFKKAMKKAQNK